MLSKNTFIKERVKITVFLSLNRNNTGGKNKCKLPLPTRWTWVWVNSGSWWWTGRPGVMQFMGSQRVRHDWAELRSTRLFRTNTYKSCPFHYSRPESKSRKSRNTWSNRQIWPWSKEWSRAKTNWVLPREYTVHSKHPLPTTQERTLHMDITRWSTPKSD